MPVSVPLTKPAFPPTSLCPSLHICLLVSESGINELERQGDKGEGEIGYGGWRVCECKCVCSFMRMCVGVHAHKCFEHGGAKERHLREAACHSAVMLIDMSAQMEREVETYRGDHERGNKMKLRDNFLGGVVKEKGERSLLFPVFSFNSDSNVVYYCFFFSVKMPLFS